MKKDTKSFGSSRYEGTSNPVPYLQVKALMELLEVGFSYEHAQKIALTIIEFEENLREEEARLSENSQHAAQLCVAPHPRGWAIFSPPSRPYLYFRSRDDALTRARSDACAGECTLKIYQEDGEFEQKVAAPRNY